MWRDSETEIDYLNFEYLVNLLTNLIDNDKLLPATIGVYGDWGSGKSSLIKMATDKLVTNDIVTLNFNGWIFEGYEDAKTVLLETILDSIQENSTLTTKGKQLLRGLYKSVDKIKIVKKGISYAADLMATGGVGIMVDQVASQFKTINGEGLTESQLEQTAKSIQDELNMSDLRNDLKEFQKNFAKLLKESKINKLVVFIDELDRCSPDTIIETLEAMRLFVFTGNTVFIIGADERHISYSVERRFAEIKGNQINIGKEYLEKLIQYPVRIPRLNTTDTEYYIFCLLLEDEFNEELSELIIDKIHEIKEEDFFNFRLGAAVENFSTADYFEKLSKVFLISQQLSNLLATGLNGNPRQCKRFLNSMKMREIMAASYNVILDRMTLTKIMLLEYFKPAAFEHLTILASKYRDGIIEELSNIEVDPQSTDTNTFKTFLEDDWGENWLKLKPSLSQVDLRGYLFFTRDSLRTPIKVTSLELSKDGLAVYKLLTSKSKSSITQALSKRDMLPQFDKIEIAKSLSNDIASTEKHGKVDSSIFRSLFEWIVVNEDILSDTLIFLRTIESVKLGLEVAPYVAYYLNSDKAPNPQVKEIIDGWRSLNSDLDRVIQQSEVS
ncbi:KAP family P-loop NTPase fold protein [Enterococcus thailandicus]|uniref:KAP family P-loop NTPase fold protein n=1 Tax=Enterococcus thailandicus TaxID=417368 RepID=UPI000BB0AD7B|nr:P-loop NTPase fold protein [Enterococcus thailandicus]ASZ07117.1 hypothetical protein CK496_04085 [Enterococcus thailandicus]